MSSRILSILRGPSVPARLKLSISTYNRKYCSKLVSRCNNAQVPLGMRNLSADARAAARKARMVEGSKTGGSSRSAVTPFRLSVLLTILGISGITWDIVNNNQGQMAEAYRNSPLKPLFDWIYERTWGSFQEIFYPVTDKLLPDWPTAPCYGNPLPGTPAPPVLVIDVEKTLIGSIHDAKHGWRHVKRPGVDRFLDALANYYEIVLFCDADKTIMMEVFDAIDKQGRCHKFGSAEGEVRDGVTLKRLDIMNREVGRILMIDDNPAAAALCERNTLFIKPFEDVYDTNDRALLDLIPLLQAFVHEDIKDFRDALDNIGSHNADEAVQEYDMRLTKKKMSEMEMRNKGLGGFIRNRLVQSTSNVRDSQVKTPVQQSEEEHEHQNETLSQKIVESQAPPVVKKKKGGLFEWLEEAEKAKEETEMRKREKMNEIYTQRMREKLVKEEKEKAKKEQKQDF